MFTIYESDVFQNPANCLYSHKCDITDEASLKAAVANDYVCAEYKDSHRNGSNFISSNCVALDCDNDDSENPADWKTPDDVRQAFPDVAFAVHFSRNHNLGKNGKAPRPKFHILFPIEPITDAQQYVALKQETQQLFPWFDANALDAARFFFGTSDPKVAFYPGGKNLSQFLEEDVFDENMPEGEYGECEVKEGRRNTTMYRFAVRILKKYGTCTKAKTFFDEKTAACVPPLDVAELDAIWGSACRFYEKIKKQEGYVAPEAYNSTDKYKPGDFSDVGQAEVLAKHFSRILRYSPSTSFLVYRRHCWRESDLSAHAVMHELTKRQLEEALNAVAVAQAAFDDAGDEGAKSKAEADLNSAKAYRAFALKRRESKQIFNALREVQHMVEIEPARLDHDPFLLCTPTGTYDLRLGIDSGRKHVPEDFITKMTAVSPSEKGRQIWLDCLDVIFSQDRELIEYVQMICGLAIIGRVYVEALIIAYGDGSNGKSTFWNVISCVLGSYSGNISADTLTVGCKRNVKPELAETKGKRMLIAAELQEGTRLNSSTVKQLCSTDDIFAEKKYKAPFSFTPCHTLILYTNHLPRVSSMDTGIWRRLIVIPFNARITGNSDIKNYAEYLSANAGESVLAWIIEGAKKVIDRGYKLVRPKCVESAIEGYRNRNDWFGEFLEDKCETGSYSESSNELYKAYRSHCSESNQYVHSAGDFYAALELAGFERILANRKRMFSGLRLKSTDDFVDDVPF